MWYVVVTDHVSYIYGPFVSEDDAKDFTLKHKNDFFGRIVNLTRGIINPVHQP